MVKLLVYSSSFKVEIVWLLPATLVNWYHFWRRGFQKCYFCRIIKDNVFTFYCRCLHYVLYGINMFGKICCRENVNKKLSTINQIIAIFSFFTTWMCAKGARRLAECGIVLFKVKR